MQFTSSKTPGICLLHVARGASLQVVSSVGPLKMVLLDSVSAVIYPVLGGRQSEGELRVPGGCRALPGEQRALQMWADVIGVTAPSFSFGSG